MDNEGTHAAESVCAYASWTRSWQGTRPLITVRGELDVASAAPFAATLVALAGEQADVVIDMSNVTFIDSAAVDAIDRVRRLFEILGQRLVVHAPSRPVHRLLRLAELSCLLDDTVVLNHTVVLDDTVLLDGGVATGASVPGPGPRHQGGAGTQLMFGL